MSITSEPTVCCILLTRDRPQMAARAVESFRRQTYERKSLFILNTGIAILRFNGFAVEQVLCHWESELHGQSIGWLRNAAIRLADSAPESLIGPRADIIAHMDDDDLSHPNRLAEQVALLQQSGADAVGYSDLLFWDSRDQGGVWSEQLPEGSMYHPRPANESWLYTRSSRLNVPGTTLCYWRKTWERKPFPDQPSPSNPFGEDVVWQSGLKVVACSSVTEMVWSGGVYLQGDVSANPVEPRMIASVHGGNTMAHNYSNIGIAHEFARTPQWDSYCRERMKL